MKGRPGYTPLCGDCRHFRKLPETAVYVSSSDGMCCHPTRNGKNRKTPYLAYSRAAACFDGEDKDEEYDGQLRLDVEGGRADE